MITGSKLFRYNTIPSTSDKAKELALTHDIEGLAVTAQRQTKGRGKPGSSWYSPRGGLYLSVIYKPYKNASRLEGFSLLAAQAVVSSIKRICGLKATIKLPNDVLVQSKKVSGILTERVKGAGSMPVLIIGIGINLNNSRFPAPLKGRADSLKNICSKSIDRDLFLKALFVELDKEYLKFLKVKI